MQQNTNMQIDYTAYEVGYQLRISLECDVRVPKDDPVRLLSAVLDRVDYRRINAAYSRLGRKEYPTRLLTKVSMPPSFRIADGYSFHRLPHSSFVHVP